MNEVKIRPESLKKYKEMDLKLGIKSSLPNVKSALALIVLLWECADRRAELVYSQFGEEEKNIVMTDELSGLVKKYLFDERKFEVQKLGLPNQQSLIDCLNNNLLFTSQIEHLMVAFELIWKLAKVSFTDGILAASSERTGGRRYPKKLEYTINVDIIHSVIENDLDSYLRVLLRWLGFNVEAGEDENSYDERNEHILLNLFTNLSEGAVFKLNDGNQDIIFNQNSLYCKVLETQKVVDINGEKEPKGSLRIFKSLLANEMHPYLNGKNNGNSGVSIKPGKLDELKQYQHRVDTFLRLSATKVIRLEESEYQNKINDYKRLGKIWFKDGKNIIYYGAPGTGKSYGVSKEIEQVYPNFKDERSDDSSFVFRTTFHPEYTYTDFVGQVMPKVTNGLITYEFVPGIFTQALAKAMDSKQEGRPVFLVLEELSRANVAAVFGDLFQLLDRHNGQSEYSITNSLIAKEVYGDSGAESKIYIPNNLHIYGTVNTNDQNVFVMDTAFKRRFEWKYVSTKPVSDENNPLIKIKGLEGNDSNVEWHKFYQRLNKFITTDMALGEDKQVGQFFIKFTDNDKENRNQLQNKLLQYLWDDVQGASFNGVKLFDPSISTFSELYDKFGHNQKVFSDDFLEKLFPYERTVEEFSSDEV